MRKKFKIITYIVFLLVFINEIMVFGHIKNNSEKINFKRITIEDGLSQTTVKYIYQDSDGYMWFATENGLNKFDGSSFEVYRYNGENSNSISGDYIVAIIEDKKGYLWVGTSRGLNRIDRKTGDIKRYIKNNKEGSISNSNICEIFIDSKDRMWVATADGINIYNEQTDSFERILYSETENILTSELIYSIVEDSNDIYWIAAEGGLNRYDEKSNQVKKYSYKENGINLINSNEIYDLYMDEDNILWASTIGGGLNKINTKTEKTQFFIRDENDANSIPGDDVRGVVRDSEGILWIATNNGLATLDEFNNSFTTYKSKIYDTTTIVNNDIFSIFQSTLGTIWVGTFDGISLFNPNNIFTTYKNDPSDDNTLSNNIIMGTYVDNNGLIWCGSSDSGINIIDRKNEKVYRLDKEGELNSLLTSKNITVINGKDDEIFIGTSNGLNYLNTSTGEFKKYLHNDIDAYKNEIRTIFIDKNGLVWVGTRRGMYTIDENEILLNYDYLFRENNIKDYVISSIFEDSEGELWIGLGYEGGLIRYNKQTGEFYNYKNDIEDENRLSFNSIRDINEDNLGNIWIATSYGLNKFDKKSNKFTRYYESDGLTNNFIYGILIDDKNNPWVSTNNGISKYDVKNNRFINFNVSDGLQGNEFNANSYFKSKDGEMFFGGISGLNSFKPENYKEDDKLTKVKISNVFINGKKNNFKKDIKLDYSDENIQIEYFLPDYMNTSKIKYIYKMEGLDSEWTYAENRNYISYNNLPSGNFRFLVCARNGSGQWSEVSSVSITKKLSPWKTPIMYFIYLIIVLLIIYNRWNRMNVLNKLVEEKTKELNNKMEENKNLYEKLLDKEKDKNNYFINLSHELRTPLNVILSTEQLVTTLNKNKEHIEKNKINHYMSVLKSNSKRLLNLINDIIDTAKIDAGQYKLDIKEHDIIYHVEELALSMKDFIESNGIELIIDPEVEEKIIQCDIDDIEKCLVNILGNAVKFTPNGGRINITIAEDGEFVKISIKDTGIGIAEKDIKEIFDRFKQAYNKKSEEFGGSGIGLTITKQIIELHNGELLVKSEVGSGSEFIMVLPINQKI